MYGTPQDVKYLTGITPEELGIDASVSINPDQTLNDILTTWLTRISSAINTRLVQGEIDANDSKYDGVVDVCVRTVAKVVAVARQNKIAPIQQIGQFAIEIINTSDVIRNLSDELKPYQKRSVQFFTSINDNCK